MMEYTGKCTLLSERVPDIFNKTNDHSDSNGPPSSTSQPSDCTMNVENLNLGRSSSEGQSRPDPNKLLHHSLPVTGLKLLDGMVLIASEGPSILTKMAYFNHQPFQRYQICPSQVVISGMEFIQAPVLECGSGEKVYDQVYIGYIWGGSISTLIRMTRSVKSGIKLLEYDYTEDKCTNEFFNLDFIPVAAKWLEGGNVLALLSVLNCVVIFERKEKYNSPGNFTDLKEVSRIKCSKSETLFSGTISGNLRNNIRIFAGTVFNGIVVWDINGEQQHSIQHELKCHNGIIFSLEYYAHRKLLLSTSDDRTVAVWQFPKENNEEVKLINRFFGHDARVWKALAVHDYIISVGESSEVRVNILQDGKEHKVWKAHDGAPIFTCAYDEDLEILYTGGNDGTIRKWPKWWYQLRPRALPFDVIPLNSEEDDTCRIQGTGRWSENKDFPKLVLLLDINHVLVSMESGRVIGFNWEGKQFDLLHDPRCEGFQIIKISPDHKVLAVAGNNGHFYTAQISFSDNQSSRMTILHAKKLFMTKISWNIITMIWLDVSRLLVICLNRAIALLLQENEMGEQNQVQFIQTFNLNLQRPGVPAALELFGKYVILGDESGSLHMFRYHKTDEVIQTFENAHKDGCTDLLYYDSKLYSSGRDGKVRIFDIKIDAENDLLAEFIPLCSFPMPFDWTAGLYVNMGQLFCCGFHKEDFIVHSLNEKRTLVKIACGGGGNRKWDFKYGHGEEGSQNASFSFVKDKEIFYTFLPIEGLLKNALRDGLHSRTINCALQLSTTQNKIDYISGSEDGSLKWFQWDVENQSILSVDSMENHVSSVRSAWKITNVSNQIYLFAGGGRSQLCIYKIDLSHRRLEPLKEIILVKTSFKQTEGDVRIMDIVVTERDNDELWCFNACSDGIVRVVYYNTKTNKFKIAGLLNGNNHAVMRIHVINNSKDLSDTLLTIIGVTSNGYLVLWTWGNDKSEKQTNLDKKLIPEKSSSFQILLRRTAFLSMRAYTSMKGKDHENYKIVCGGDDCSVSLWTLAVTKENDNIKYTVDENWVKDQCQRGAVVGVEIVNDCIYTLSNDQIIGEWDMNGKLNKTVFAGVSDCQGFVVDSISKCIMCFGKGISWIPVE